jgi:hypothetical protein
LPTMGGGFGVTMDATLDDLIRPSTPRYRLNGSDGLRPRDEFFSADIRHC